MNHDAHITRSRSRRRLSSRKASPSRSPAAQLGRILQPLEELTQGKVLVERDGRLAFGLSLTRAHGGYIDRYVGDAILAIFPDGPDDALQAALAMQRQVDLFNQAREKAGEPPVAIGVGVHSGPLVLTSARASASRGR